MALSSAARKKPPSRSWKPTEAIDNAATALSKVTSPDQQKLLSEEIQERVVSIFEACNFQDLTGQRIKKVMSTMKFIENHITVMMDIWGGVDAIKAHAPPIVDHREGDAKLSERSEAGRRCRSRLAGRYRRAVRLAIDSFSKEYENAG